MSPNYQRKSNMFIGLSFTNNIHTGGKIFAPATFEDL